MQLTAELCRQHSTFLADYSIQHIAYIAATSHIAAAGHAAMCHDDVAMASDRFSASTGSLAHHSNRSADDRDRCTLPGSPHNQVNTQAQLHLSASLEASSTDTTGTCSAQHYNRNTAGCVENLSCMLPAKIPPDLLPFIHREKFVHHAFSSAVRIVHHGDACGCSHCAPAGPVGRDRAATSLPFSRMCCSRSHFLLDAPWMR